MTNSNNSPDNNLNLAVTVDDILPSGDTVSSFLNGLNAKLTNEYYPNTDPLGVWYLNEDSEDLALGESSANALSNEALDLLSHLDVENLPQILPQLATKVSADHTELAGDYCFLLQKIALITQDIVAGNIPIIEKGCEEVDILFSHLLSKPDKNMVSPLYLYRDFDNKDVDPVYTGIMYHQGYIYLFNADADQIYIRRRQPNNLGKIENGEFVKITRDKKAKKGTYILRAGKKVSSVTICGDFIYD